MSPRVHVAAENGTKERHVSSTRGHSQVESRRRLWSTRAGVTLANAVRPLPYFRGRYRILNSLLPQNRREWVSIYGARMELDLSDYIQRNVFIGSYEVEETNWVRGLLHAGMTFVDVGANVGYFSALAARLVGTSGRVIAFEPNPSAYGQLRSWIEAASFPQVQCFQIAMSSAPGDLTLYTPPESEHNNTANVCGPWARDWSSISVPADTLDSFLEHSTIERVDLLKIDVDGHEPDVFQGAANSILSGKIRAIFAEFQPSALERGGSSPEILAQWLNDRGFDLSKSTPTNRLLVYRLRSPAS
jgi:FkbM family methyltransferase